MSDTEIQFTSKIDVSLVKWCGRDGDIINAARVSTQGLDALNGPDALGLIDYLVRNRHGSPFEHGLMTFMVTAPLFVWREHHRHRVGFSYNEESGRYKKLDPRFYVPEVARTQTGKPGHYDIVSGSDDQTKLMRDCVGYANRIAYQEYENMLAKGVAREVARMVLPVNIMSSCFVTCNPRSMMNFLSLRTERAEAHFPSKPQLEIQMLAEQYENHFSRLYPITWKAFNNHGRVAP